MNHLPAQKINGLIDGMAVLQTLAVAPTPMGGNELAQLLNRSPVRINRILKTFASLGVTYRTRSRKYTVGPAMHVIAAQSMAASGLLGSAIGYLEKLSASQVTVALGVLWRDRVCYLFHHSATDPSVFLSGLRPHALYDAADSSIGVALLAELADSELQLIYPDGLPAPSAAALAAARRDGYGLLHHADHYSLAVKIGNPAYAAIAISALPDLEAVAEYVPILRGYAQNIELEAAAGKGI